MLLLTKNTLIDKCQITRSIRPTKQRATRWRGKSSSSAVQGSISCPT
jgi:hypothetical protein